MSDLMTLYRFFGKKEGQTTEDFKAECHALTPEEIEALVTAIEGSLEPLTDT